MALKFLTRRLIITNIFIFMQKKFGFRAVTFTGFLQITDLDKFKQALVNGLGREKAYGMGLLTVA